jgi:hypothetical protein
MGNFHSIASSEKGFASSAFMSVNLPGSKFVSISMIQGRMEQAGFREDANKTFSGREKGENDVCASKLGEISPGIVPFDDDQGDIVVLRGAGGKIGNGLENF